MIPAITLRRAFSDPKLLGGVLSGPSWRWRCSENPSTPPIYLFSKP
jgi:hypothetical protein